MVHETVNYVLLLSSDLTSYHAPSESHLLSLPISRPMLLKVPLLGMLCLWMFAWLIFFFFFRSQPSLDPLLELAPPLFSTSATLFIWFDFLIASCYLESSHECVNLLVYFLSSVVKMWTSGEQRACLLHSFPGCWAGRMLSKHTCGMNEWMNEWMSQTHLGLTSGFTTYKLL